MKRDNFDSYIQLLRDNGVDRLYHVTSRENWESIRMNGIYSAENQQRNNMASRPIMDEMSRIRDHKLGLDKYVHLSFSANPVFLEAALKAKTAGEDYLVVEISLDVLNNDEVIFCNMDSHYEDVLKGTSYSHLSSINIKAASATQRDQIALKNRRFCSAEVLIPAHVSSGHILNRIELDNKVNDIQKGDEFKRNLIVIMVDETVNMKHPIIARGHSYSSAAKYAEAAINKLITKVALSYNSGGKVSDKYDIAVFGCGYSYGIAPLWDRKYSDDGCSFRSAHDLYDTFIRNLGEGTPRWIQTGSNSYDANYEKAFKKVKEFLQDWLDNNSIYCNPPIVILLTSGLSVYQNPAGFSNGCNELKQLQTLSGNVILWQIEYNPMSNTSVLCPEEDGDTAGLDPFALFMSKQVSVLPDMYTKNLMKIRSNVDNGNRYLCFGVNADLLNITDLLMED